MASSRPIGSKLCLILAFVGAVAAAAAVAESVPVSGLSLPVEEITPVDALSVTVSLGGQTALVTRAALPDFVLQRYVENPALRIRLDPGGLERLVESATREGAIERAGVGFAGLMSHPAGEAERLAALLLVIAELPAGPAVARASLIRLMPDRRGDLDSLLPPLFTAAALKEPGWLSTTVGPLLRAQRGGLSSYLTGQLVGALKLRELDRAREILVFAGETLGRDDRQYQRLVVLVDRTSRTLADASRGDLDALQAALDLSSNDPELSRLLAPIVTEGLHQEGSRALEAGDVERAIMSVARIKFERRTQTTHEILRGALARYQPVAQSVLGEVLVSEAIAAIAAQDEVVRERWFSALERQVQYLIDRGALTESERYMGRLVESRPDPSSGNDRLRYEQALAWYRAGAPVLARQRLTGVQSGGLWGYRLRIAWFRFCSSPDAIILVCVFLVILLGLIYSLYRRGQARSEAGTEPRPASSDRGKRAAASGREDEEESEDDAPPRGFMVSEMRRFSPAMQEYHRLLEHFSLSPAASVREIKAAYRNAVKEVHPDLRPDSNEASSARFVELTRIYDRVLELRRDLGFTD